MVKSRSREMSRTETAGTTVNDVGTVEQHEVQTLWKQIDDFYEKKVREDGSLPPSALTIQEVDNSSYGTISGKKSIWTFYNRPYSSSPVSSNLSIFTDLEGTDAELVSQLLADTNPFRAEVSVPILVAELAEAASLLKIDAKNLATASGSTYLTAKFGYETLISDIRKLASITETIESRVKEFNSLVQKGGLRRSKKLSGGGTTVTAYNVPVHTAYTTSVYANRSTLYQTKVWGSVRWRPKRKELLAVEKLQLYNEAVRQVLDIEQLDGATIWESIPFSWLVDYFTTIGNTLKAIEGSDLVEPYDICIMRQRTITSTYTPTSSPVGVTATKGVGIRRYKLRKTFSSSTSELLGFGFLLSGGQALTILALLAVLRGRR